LGQVGKESSGFKETRLTSVAPSKGFSAGKLKIRHHDLH
jgi:hypothetical protein